MKLMFAAAVFAIAAVAAPAGATTLAAAGGTYSYALNAGVHSLSGTDLGATIPYTYNVAQPASGGSYAITFRGDAAATSSRVDFSSDAVSWGGPYSDSASDSFSYSFMITGPTPTVAGLLSAYAILTDSVTGDVRATATAGLAVQCDACATPLFSSSDLVAGLTYADLTLQTGVEYTVRLTTAVSLGGSEGTGTARAYVTPAIGVDPAVSDPTAYTMLLSDGVRMDLPSVPPSVPEPASLALLLSGAAMLCGVRFRRGA